MPIRLLFFVPLLFCVTIFAQDAAREREAERFHREALLLHGQRSYELALEMAETAFALEPENQKYKETLVRCLNDRARSLLINRIDVFGYTKDKMIATPEGAAKSVVLMNRAFDLIEKDSRFFEFARYGPLVSFPGRYFYLLSAIDADIYPEWEADTDKFKNRIFTDWMDYRYSEYAKQVVDKRSFLNWRSCGIPPQYLIDYAPPEITASAFETYYRDVFTFQKKYEAELSNSEKRPWGHFAFLPFAEQQLMGPETEENRPARQIIERTMKSFSEQGSVYHDVFAWLVLRKKHGGDIVCPEPIMDEDGRSRYPPGVYEAYQKAVDDAIAADEEEFRNKINSIPPKTLLDEYVDLYLALIELPRSPPYNKASIDVNRMLDIFEFALDRGDIVYEPIKQIVQFGLPLNSETKQRTADACKRAIDDIDTGIASVADNDNVRENLRIDYEVCMAALEPPSGHAPWKEETVLFTEKQAYRPYGDDGPLYVHDYYGPFCLSGETLCVLNRRKNLYENLRDGKQTTIRPVLVDLNTLQKTELAPWIHSEDRRRSYDLFHSDWQQLFCGERYVCLATNGCGIVVFPRNGDEPFVIDQDSDLPDNYVQGLGILGSTLYAGVGNRGSATWLVGIDLPSRKVEILASSRGRSGKAPFFDLPEGPQYRNFLYDSKRNRLLFEVWMKNKHPKQGLWTVDGKNGEFVCLTDRSEVLCTANNKNMDRGEILADGDTYLSGRANRHFLTDLRDGTVRELDVRFQQCTIQGGWIWGFMQTQTGGDYSFGRTKIDQLSDFEQLAFPQLRSFNPAILATPDGKGLILNGDSKIILIRL